MSKQLDNGGSAFPRPMVGSDQAGTVDFGAEGMSLRDYFAGQALAGLMADPNVTFNREGSSEKIAMVCYVMADAMLKARQQ